MRGRKERKAEEGNFALQRKGIHLSQVCTTTTTMYYYVSLSMVLQAFLSCLQDNELTLPSLFPSSIKTTRFILLSKLVMWSHVLTVSNSIIICYDLFIMCVCCFKNHHHIIGSSVASLPFEVFIAKLKLVSHRPLLLHFIHIDIDTYVLLLFY